MLQISTNPYRDKTHSTKNEFSDRIVEVETTQTKTHSTTSNQKGIMAAMRIVAEHPEGPRTMEGNDEE